MGSGDVLAFGLFFAGAVCASGCDKEGAAPQAPKSATRADSAGDARPDPADEWDRQTPIELGAWTTHRRFVTATRASICPTRASAEANGCGDSVESTEEGSVARRGAAVTVVGDGPVDGWWRAVRYTKAGTLPGWIAADAVAVAPDLSALEAFDREVSDREAQDATSMTAAEVAALPEGERLRWTRLSAERLRFGTSPAPPASRVYVEDPGGGTSSVGAVAVDVALVQQDGRHYLEAHPCVRHGDCLDLAYLCTDDYCDSIAIEGVTTGDTADVPPDPEGEWPADLDPPLPRVRATLLADRLGLFEPPAAESSGSAQTSVNPGGAPALLERVGSIERCEIVDTKSREVLGELSEQECARLGTLLDESDVSRGLAMTPPYWRAVFRLEMENADRFVLGPLVQRLRVNERNPYSSRTADGEGRPNPPWIHDIGVSSDDWRQISAWMRKYGAHKTDSKHHRTPDPLQELE